MTTNEKKTQVDSLASPAWKQAVAKVLADHCLAITHVSNDQRPARDNARLTGQSVATNLDTFWARSSEVRPGPIHVLDMFSGCGGMTTGFRSANGTGSLFDIKGAVDIEPTANQSYEANHRVKPFSADIAKLAHSSSDLNAFLDRTGFSTGEASVLIGCAPCQGFSSHRNSQGEMDPRNSLFVDFANIARTIAPDAILIENVPELLTDQYWPLVREARRILEEAGYFVHIAVHNMAEFGVPQERFRALILALKRPFVAPIGFLSPSDFQTVRGAIGHLPPVGPGERNQQDPLHMSAGHRPSTIETIRAVPKNGGNRPSNVGPDCLRRGEVRTGKPMYEDVYGRLHWDKPAITITAYSRNPASGRFVHPEQDRGLTIREAALLQSFPTDYSFSGSLDSQFRQIGNAVPPSFAAYLALHVVGELLSEAISPDLFDRGITESLGSSFSRMIPGIKSRRPRVKEPVT